MAALSEHTKNLKKLNWYKIKVAKTAELRFISHLDWQSLIIKTFKRMGLKLALSQGFSPAPKVSFSPALPLFIESECEIVYFETVEPLDETDFAANFAKNTSENVKLKEFLRLEGDKKPQPPETLVQWAKYEAKLYKSHSALSPKNCPIPIFKNPLYNEAAPRCSSLAQKSKRSTLAFSRSFRYNIENCLLSDNLFIKKINKKGFEKNIDYKNSVKNIEFDEKNEKIIFTLKAGQGLTVPALRADDFLAAVFGKDVLFEIKRTQFFDEDLIEI